MYDLGTHKIFLQQHNFLKVKSHEIELKILNAKQFIKTFKIHSEDLQAEKRHSTPNYNIFDILHIKTKEAAVHTPFLVNLLNSDGSHNQKNIFISLFLEHVLEINKSDLLDWKILEIQAEKVTTKGNIDIFIRGKKGDSPFAIIIENKVHARDQPKQLTRYYEYMINILGLPSKDCIIIYLSPSGKPPSIGNDDNDSLTQQLYNFLTNEKILRLISYKKTITKWLEECLREISAPKVTSLIEQYLKTIKHF